MQKIQPLERRKHGFHAMNQRKLFVEVRIENVHFQAFSGGRDDQTTAWNCFIEFSWEVADEPSVKSGERMEVSVKPHNMGTRTRRNSRRLTSFTRMAGLRLREKKKTGSARMVGQISEEKVNRPAAE